MNFYKKRHKLLELLNEQKKVFDSKEQASAALSFASIQKVLKVDRVSLNQITSVLTDRNEIKLNEVVPVGYIILDAGINSCITKKYKRELEARRWETAKNWIQTVIPVLSLISVIIIQISSYNREQAKESKEESIRQQLNKVQQEIQKIQHPTKIHPTTLSDSASISDGYKT